MGSHRRTVRVTERIPRAGSLTTGGQTTLTVPLTGTLRHVWLTHNANSSTNAPVLGMITIQYFDDAGNEFDFPLVAGWMRAGDDYTEDGLLWSGVLQVPNDGFRYNIFIVARNDTGANVVLDLMVLMEDG